VYCIVLVYSVENSRFQALFFPERVVYTFSLGIYHAAEVWQISGYCTFKQR